MVISPELLILPLESQVLFGVWSVSEAILLMAALLMLRLLMVPMTGPVILLVVLRVPLTVRFPGLSERMSSSETNPT